MWTKFLNYSDSKERFEAEKQSAKSYAEKNNMTFKVIYDSEIGFNSKKYKQYLKNNPEVIEKYKISFIRNWS